MKSMILAGVFSVCAIMAIGSERGKSVYNDLIGDPVGRRANPPGSDLNMVTPDIRDEVMLYLRRYASGLDSADGGKTDLSHNPSAKLLLMRLGDEQQIEERKKVFDAILAEFGGYSLGAIIYDGEVAHPLLIPHLAKNFLAEDGDKTWEYQRGDIGDLVYPKSIGCAVSTLGIMRNSPAFSPAVRNWADKTYIRVRYAEELPEGAPVLFPKSDAIDLTALRKAMREWWKENAGSFAAKDYASVKPGAWLPAAKVPATGDAVKDMGQPPASKVEPPSTTVTGAEPAQASSSSSPLIYPFAIGSSLLLLAAIAFFLRRKKSR